MTPDDNPQVLRFDAVFNGEIVRVMAVARHDQIDLIPTAGVRLEIPLPAFQNFVAHALVAAHARPD